MIASTPHVSVPPTRRHTIGNVPPGPRDSNGGRAPPRTRSSIPPVPNVILASPQCTHPCPRSDACWSPAIPAIGGAPGRAVASPTTPDESTMVGSIDAGMRSGSRASSAHWDASGASRPVTAALVASVTCSAAPDNVHAIQVSTVPKHRSRARCGSTCSSNHSSLVADAFGASRRPWPRSSRQRPTVRRSCQPSAGPTGSPVARSHTTVEQRWLAMPTASTGPAASSAARAASRAVAAIPVASNSTRPGAGDDGSRGRVSSCMTRVSLSTTAARTDDVPTSTTRMLTASPRRRRGRAGRACPGSGSRGGRGSPSPPPARRTPRRAPHGRSGPGSAPRRGGG